MLIKDQNGKKVKISMRILNNTNLSENIASDFFDGQEYVKDIEYCIECAEEWEKESENNILTIERI